ncbi:type II secretion system inner membrane protein GspF [Candidatus Uabimicrobium amorphum]|uniref:General secretion pathway protein F n=1 Tax=Uabimicrobium amorphum TaxID=2596890 RepID=A0A5S9F0M2_UABAM|nr:type II secretion system inner membrane protein GspF [Candidatus Uabimicrobium amorphum]BBM81757.1 type II secretion system protein F [Candidatus Uabimicrobium amorphum]
MPIYEYKALGKSGQIKRGLIDADSPKDARDKLRMDRIHVMDLKVMNKKKSASGSKGRSGKKIKPMELAMITRQLATLIESDIKLREAISVLIDQIEDKSVQIVFRDIREKITAGTTFADALAQHAHVFPELYIHMVRAGEAAGNLDTILNQLANYLQAQSRMKGKVSAALAYPMMMSLIGVVVVIFLVTFVVPKIRRAIESQGAELPVPTKILIFLSDFFINWWWLVLGIVIALAIAFKSFISSQSGRRAFDRFCLSLPIFGILFKKQSVSRFAVTFSTLLQSGLPALESLRIVRNVVDNKVMEETLDEVEKNIIDGNGISVAIRKSDVFPSVVGYMISVGEQSGNLDKVLVKIASAYDEEVEITTQKVTSLLEPIMIVSLSAIVGFIVLAIIMPIMQMSQL